MASLFDKYRDATPPTTGSPLVTPLSGLSALGQIVPRTVPGIAGPVAIANDGRQTTPGMRGPVAPDSGLPSDAWEQQLWAILSQRYAHDPAKAQEEFNYYKAKRASDEVSGRAGAGREFATMDDYWLHRATGRDAQDQPGAVDSGMSGLPPGFSLTGANGLASFGAPGLLAPFTQEFVAPDPNAINNDRSYQWILGRGTDALNKAASARGTINTGGADKDKAEFAAGLASQFDDKYYNRAWDQYLTRYNIYDRNQANAFNRLAQTSNAGLTAASQYAPGVSDLATTRGDVNATAGAVRSNNWADLFGGLANVGSRLFANRAQTPTTTPTTTTPEWLRPGFG